MHAAATAQDWAKRGVISSGFEPQTRAKESHSSFLARGGFAAAK